jgi:ACS family glucarate transporter-like MFS transporter
LRGLIVKAPIAAPLGLLPELERPTWVRYHVLAAGCTLAVLTYVLRQSFTFGLTWIRRDFFPGGDEEAANLGAAFLVAYGIFQVPGGLLGDRFGGRSLLTILVLFSSLLTGAVAVSVLLPRALDTPFYFLLVLRFLFGMFQAGIFPAWARVVADWMPVQERATAQGTVWTFSRLGGVVSSFVFLGLFQLFGTWTTPFWCLAGLGFMWCALFWPWFRNRPEEMQQVNAAERDLIASGRSRATAPAGPVPWGRMLTSPSVWGLCLMYGGVGFAGNFVTALLPDYLQSHRHLSPETAASIFALTFASGLVACAFGGFLSDWIIRRTGNRKWGRRIIGAIGLVFAAIAYAAVPWATEAWVLGLLFCTSFFFNDVIMGPAWASCADIGERYAGTLSGAMNMVGAFAGAAGMRVAGFLLKSENDILLFAVFGCSYFLAALSWLLVDVTKPLTEKA